MIFLFRESKAVRLFGHCMVIRDRLRLSMCVRNIAFSSRDLTLENALCGTRISK